MEISYYDAILTTVGTFVTEYLDNLSINTLDFSSTVPPEGFYKKRNAPPIPHPCQRLRRLVLGAFGASS